MEEEWAESSSGSRSSSLTEPASLPFDFNPDNFTDHDVVPDISGSRSRSFQRQRTPLPATNILLETGQVSTEDGYWDLPGSSYAPASYSDFDWSVYGNPLLPSDSSRWDSGLYSFTSDIEPPQIQVLVSAHSESQVSAQNTVQVQVPIFDVARPTTAWTSGSTWLADSQLPQISTTSPLPSLDSADPALPYAANNPPVTEEHFLAPPTPALTYGAPTPQSQTSVRGSLSPREITRDPTRRQRRAGPASKTHICSSCNRKFVSNKDRERHEVQKHPKLGPDGETYSGWYLCRCSHTTSRRDDFYKRHLPSCSKNSIRPNYVCRCSQPFTDREEFTQHVSTCGLKLRGRPPKASTPAADPAVAEWSD